MVQKLQARILKSSTRQLTVKRLHSQTTFGANTVIQTTLASGVAGLDSLFLLFHPCRIYAQDHSNNVLTTLCCFIRLGFSMTVWCTGRVLVPLNTSLHSKEEKTTPTTKSRSAAFGLRGCLCLLITSSVLGGRKNEIR